LLLSATDPPTGRIVLVNGFDASVTTQAGTLAISSQRYSPDVIHPDGRSRIADFQAVPWPRWTYRLGDGQDPAQEDLVQEVFVPHGYPAVVVSWRLAKPEKNASLSVRLFLSGRDYHSLHHENPDFRFDAKTNGESIQWRPYQSGPSVLCHSNGVYSHRPDWFRNFLYDEERARGLDCQEDLATPGVLTFDLGRSEAVLILSAEFPNSHGLNLSAPALSTVEGLRRTELERRSRYSSDLHRAADAYIVRRGQGKTIIAGYPWFTDWGRDTFISMRGLCICGQRLDDARDILLEWAHSVSEGMLPNRFCDHGEAPEYHSVDASLWYVIAVHEFLKAAKAANAANLSKLVVGAAQERALHEATDAILTGFHRGTRFDIRCDKDGLLMAGEAGRQLTWMDAKIGDWVVTPRIGKPVEIQALWLNALSLSLRSSDRWRSVYERGFKSFRERFWNAASGCLYDIVDVDHEPGTVDPAFRPNQIFSVGGLPLVLLEKEQARAVVDAVEKHLLTPLGLRSLAPAEPNYVAHYSGGPRDRDAAYHQGTVWPWLAGPFVEAWIRVRGDTSAVRNEARERFLQPLLDHLNEAGIGHISEIADGDPPHTPRGCPFQAWSVGEAMRIAALTSPLPIQSRKAAGRLATIS
jgi:predicted glycogen debranching enzyme